MASEGKRLAELYGRAQSGDREAVEELCKNLEKYVRGYFWQKFQNNTIVDDLCQETYLRLIKNLLRVREAAKLRGFVAKVALHVSQDYFRQKYRRKETNSELDLSEEDIHSQASDESERQADETILDQIDLEDALTELPRKSREILVLKSQGYNYEEIANKTDLSVSGVKMQVKRTLETLREALFLVTFSGLAATSIMKSVFKPISYVLKGWVL